MAELETDLIMRTDQPMQAVAQLDRALTEVATSAGDQLGDALARGVQIDGSPITTEITESVESADTTAVVEPDTTEVAPSIENAVSDADTETVIEPDAEAIAPAVETAISDADKTAAIDPDTTEIAPAIEEAVSSADTTVELDVQAPEAGAPGGQDFAKNVLAGKEATDLLTASTGALQGSMGGLAAKVGPVGVGITAVAGAVGVFFNEAAQARDVTDRFNATLGTSAAQIDHIDIGGLNTDLSDLAIKLGASDDGLRQVATDIGILGQTSGASQRQIAQTAEEVLALSANVAALHPEMGTADQIAGQLQGALARGGRAARQFGLDLESAEIKTRATQIALADGRIEVSQFDLVAAGAALTTEKLGDSIGANVERGSKQAGVQLRSLRTEISETIEGMGEPLVEPILETFQALRPVLVETVKAAGQALVALGPAIKTVGDALSLVTPILQKFNEGLAAISPNSTKVVDSVFALSDALHGPVVQGMKEHEAGLRGVGFAADPLPQTFDAVTDSLDLMGRGITDAAAIIRIEGVVSIEDLSESMEKSRKVTDDLQASVTSALPTIGAAFDKVAKDGKASMEELRQALLDQFIAESQFFINLKTIVEKGGHDVAAAILAQGPERGAAAAQAVATATVAEVAQLEFQAQQIITLHHDFGEQYATAVGQGFADGILRAVPIMDTATVQAVTKVKTSGANVLGIRSPSSVFFDYGVKVVLGLAGGIRSSLPVVGAAIGELQRFTVGGGSATVNMQAPGAPTAAGPVSQTIIVNAATDPEATAQAVSMRVLQGAQR